MKRPLRVGGTNVSARTPRNASHGVAGPPVTRRSIIAAGAGALAAFGIGARPAIAAGAGLAGVAAEHGKFYGAAVRSDQLAQQPDLRAAILAECAYIVPEIELKWAAIEPAYGQLSFTGVDDLAQFALANRKRLRGHTLLWHLSVPAWADQALRTRSDWTLISRYFASVIPRYGDVIDQWDVVNEPIDTGHRMDGLRENVFLAAFGPDYIRRALVEARTFAPHGKLMINDYGFEYDTTEQRSRRYLFLKLVDRLKNAGAPLDGVGLQSHLDLGNGSISQTSVATFLKELAALGLAIVVTELDVKEVDYAAPVDRRDRMVGDEVRRYLDVVLDQRAVSGVVTWGLSDRQSWLQVTPQDYARFPGAWSQGSGPGLNRGLPLDASLRRKPMYVSIQDALSTH
jgi:endo-1,4-beta-xylanase